MKKCLLISAIVLGLGMASSISAFAQAPGVSVIDLGYVIKEHAGFKAAMERMKQDVQKSEEELKGERESLQQLVTQFQQNPEFKKGTKEHKEMEEELARRQADLQIKINVKRREFTEREARIYYNVYREIMDVVRSHCQAKGLGLVIRYSGDEVDPADPNSILKELNKQVVHFETTIDITPTILAAVNKRPAAGGTRPANPGTATRPGTGARPRQE